MKCAICLVYHSNCSYKGYEYVKCFFSKIAALDGLDYLNLWEMCFLFAINFEQQTTELRITVKLVTLLH